MGKGPTYHFVICMTNLDPMVKSTHVLSEVSGFKAWLGNLLARGPSSSLSFLIIKGRGFTGLRKGLKKMLRTRH